MKRTLFVCCLAAVVGLSIGCESTPEGPTVAPIGLNANDPGVQDETFIREALATGFNDMEASKLAMQRASNLDVQLLARRIYDDHKRGNEELHVIAHNEGITIPQLPRDTEIIEHLSSYTGTEFDYLYLQHVLDHHNFDIKKFEATARSARNEDIRNFAGKTLPALQEHVRIAKNINEIAGLGIEINEAAGSERKPFYENDSQRQFPAVEVSP